MKVYAINNTIPNSYIKAPRNNAKPETVTRDFQPTLTQDMSFGRGISRALKWVITAGAVVTAFVNPAVLGVACVAGGAGYLAGKIAEAVAMDPEEQKTIAENGKDTMDDIIKDTFPY